MTERVRHARLKPVGDPSPRRRMQALVLTAGALTLVGLLLWGVLTAYETISGIYHRQCRILDTDTDAVVTVTPGKMVTPDVITLHFGLTNGANLAEIDFEGLRRKLLDRVPNIRALTIERRLPNRVTIDVAEREPVARVTSAAKNAPAGLMVDAEGVLFRFARSAAVFPVIRAGADMRLQPGERLTGHNAAALRLLEVAAQPEFLVLNIQEADATPKEFLRLTLGNYVRAKIAWERMDEGVAPADASLKKQLTRLKQAMATNLASPGASWNATNYATPGRVYATENDR